MAQVQNKHEVLEVDPEYVPDINRGRSNDIHVGHDLLEKEAVVEHEFNPQWLQSVQRFRDKYYINIFFAEAAGSFFFLIFLLMSLGGMTTSDGALGNYGFSMASLGVSVTLSLYVAFPVSGGHISPPITMVFVLFRKFPIRMVPIYIFGQIVGALAATAFTFGVCEAWFNEEALLPRPAALAGMYVSAYNPGIPIGTAVMNELIGDIIFVFITVAVTDLRNPLISPSLGPALVGLNLFICANSFGWAYWVLNPLRDIIPRAYISQTYSGLFDHGYWAVAMFVPFLAHFLGALLYEIAIAKTYKVPITDRRAEHNRH